MSLKDKIKITFSAAFFWRLGITALVLVCLSLAAILWMSGTKETQNAFDEGRRLLIRIDKNTVEGKLISLEKKEPPVAQAPATPPVGTPPATEPTAAAPPVTAPVTATPAPAPEGGKAAPGSPTLETMAPVPSAAIDTTRPAAVPLLGVNQLLTETVDVGLLPALGSDGTKSWRYYSKPFERKSNLPMIAIIVTGLGNGKNVSDSAMKLPENVTLSFSPYAKDVASWVAAARTTGHEVLIDLPLEPANYPAADSGPYGLLVGKGLAENNTRLQWLMSRFQCYVGFVTPQNELFTANDEAFKGLLQNLANRGLMLVVGREPPKTETRDIIELGIAPTLVADVLLDEELSSVAIQARLASLEKTARDRGYAVGIAQAYPITLQQLGEWAAKLEKNGVMLVPVTFIAKFKFS